MQFFSTYSNVLWTQIMCFVQVDWNLLYCYDSCDATVIWNPQQKAFTLLWGQCKAFLKRQEITNWSKSRQGYSRENDATFHHKNHLWNALNIKGRWHDSVGETDKWSVSKATQLKHNKNLIRINIQKVYLWVTEMTFTERNWRHAEDASYKKILWRVKSRLCRSPAQLPETSTTVYTISLARKLSWQ